LAFPVLQLGFDRSLRIAAEEHDGYGWYQYLAASDHLGDRPASVGTKRLKSIGSDLGSAVKGFRSAMSEGESAKQEDEEPKKLEEAGAKRVAEGQSAPADKERI
jgi:sec-independent protein translocase protein TatA